jgi:hypothetical protein
LGGVKLKKLICGFLVFLLFYSNISLASEKPNSRKSPPPKKFALTIKSKEMLISNDFLYFTYRMPIIEGLKNEEIQSNINSSFEKAVMDFKNDLESQAMKDFEESRATGVPFRQYGGDVNYKVTFNKNNILSIPMTFYSYTGGAHGLTLQKPYNINTQTGEKISLKDIFKENINYKNIINEEIKKQIKKDPTIYFPNVLEIVDEAGYKQPFYITKDGIVVYYDLYEIAPYAAGIREFKIPFSLFGEGVNPTFLKVQ